MRFFFWKKGYDLVSAIAHRSLAQFPTSHRIRLAGGCAAHAQTAPCPTRRNLYVIESLSQAVNATVDDDDDDDDDATRRDGHPRQQDEPIME